ncbi:ABC transporter ATP-binding protein [Thiohalophilus sp.]|uniref:ABC transporter ATP-binding protein n=1 Tax=Thiohalophilus sp. TaxID=3028392 RepID=UPI002ACEBA1F|nr:ATP-binding cassette domain-containing protein [Thiohalophilus sp.]MDZ7804552.1 ATP-binding cassette domain-containing protein [Thiohalophilus sp.]
MNKVSSRFFVEARHLGKQVNTRDGVLTLLHDINFGVEAGMSLAILGASGSGKTTLLGLLAGLDLPTEGEVILDGYGLNAFDEDGRAQLRAERVGFVFQNFQLLPGLTAVENVMLPLELARAARPRQMAEQVLNRVGLGQRCHHYPNQLSGGEQQRCAIARAFATQPRVLFADEPTGNLDSETGRRIIELLFELNAEQDTTLVMATHDSHLSQLCQQRLYLDAGHLIEPQPGVRYG